MEKSSSSSAKKGKKKKNVPKQATQSKKKPQVSEGKCFTCGQKGHWKNNCPKKPRTQNGNTLGMPLIFVIEICLIACTTST